MRTKQLWRKVYLLEIWGDLLEIQLLIKLYLELWLEVICAEVELDSGVLVAGDRLLLVDNGVGEAGIERVVEDALGLLCIVDCAVEIDMETFI